MTTNIALLGLGHWGPNLARALSTVDGAALHTICDTRPERLKVFAREFPGVRRTEDVQSVVADPAVHAIVIATPVHTHHALAADALKAGKHVLVEKPLAKTPAECENLIGLAESKKLTLMVGHVFLYNPAVRKVKDYIDSGDLGKVLYVYSQRLNLGILRADVNALWNFAPHDISVLDYWLGAMPAGAQARGFSYIQPGIEDVVFLTLDYPGGVGANVHLSWLDPRKVRTMTVVGSKKMIVYDDVSADARVVIFDRGVDRIPKMAAGESPLGSHENFAQFQLLLRAGDVMIPKIDFTEPLKLECSHFVDCIRTGKRPQTDGAHALRVVRVLDAAQKSLEHRGAWTPVE